MEHFLLHCVKTRVLWELLFSIFGVVWVSPKTVGGYPLELEGGGGGGVSIGKKKEGVACGTFFLVLDSLEG